MTRAGCVGAGQHLRGPTCGVGAGEHLRGLACAARHGDHSGRGAAGAGSHTTIDGQPRGHRVPAQCGVDTIQLLPWEALRRPHQGEQSEDRKLL
eukprot:1194914-Prorocentrum_minimum.AAC.6